jgi:uncharacterized membrane protein
VASVGLYALAVGLALVSPWISCAIYVIVSLLWFVPDSKIEREVGH